MRKKISILCISDRNRRKTHSLLFVFPPCSSVSPSAPLAQRDPQSLFSSPALPFFVLPPALSARLVVFSPLRRLDYPFPTVSSYGKITWFLKNHVLFRQAHIIPEPDNVSDPPRHASVTFFSAGLLDLNCSFGSTSRRTVHFAVGYSIHTSGYCARFF